MKLIETLKNRTGALKVADLAELFGVTPQYIYKMAASGDIPSFRISGSVRFDPGEVAAWLQERRAPVVTTYTQETTFCDACFLVRETRKVWGHDYCRVCYPAKLGLPHVPVDDRWLPVEPFPDLMAATRWFGPMVSGQLAVEFLRELPQSLSNNAELVMQFVPYMMLLSELPEDIKHYEPQLRFAIDVCKNHNRILGLAGATLEYAYECWKWHDNYLKEGESRAAFFAAHGMLQRDYRAEHAALVQRANMSRRCRQRKRHRFAREGP
ncbi:MAG: helix-turn-helix domain-containing protein [Candidatus Acidiferrales bacterium]